MNLPKKEIIYSLKAHQSTHASLSTIIFCEPAQRRTMTQIENEYWNLIACPNEFNTDKNGLTWEILKNLESRTNYDVNNDSFQ